MLTTRKKTPEITELFQEWFEECQILPSESESSQKKIIQNFKPPMIDILKTFGQNPISMSSDLTSAEMKHLTQFKKILCLGGERMKPFLSKLLAMSSTGPIGRAHSQSKSTPSFRLFSYLETDSSPRRTSNLHDFIAASPEDSSRPILFCDDSLWRYLDLSQSAHPVDCIILPTADSLTDCSFQKDLRDLEALLSDPASPESLSVKLIQVPLRKA